MNPGSLVLGPLYLTSLLLALQKEGGREGGRKEKGRKGKKKKERREGGS